MVWNGMLSREFENQCEEVVMFILSAEVYTMCNYIHLHSCMHLIPYQTFRTLAAHMHHAHSFSPTTRRPFLVDPTHKQTPCSSTIITRLAPTHPYTTDHHYWWLAYLTAHSTPAIVLSPDPHHARHDESHRAYFAPMRLSDASLSPTLADTS